jgi:ribonuclease J
VVVENGTILELDDHSLNVGERIPGGYIYVQGSSVGDIEPAVIRDREVLSENGFVVLVVDTTRDGKIIGKPEFVSRGFADGRDSQELFQGAEDVVLRTLRKYGDNGKRVDDKVADALGRYLYNETRRRPVVQAIIR